MNFVYKKWDAFCASLAQKGYVSISAKDVAQNGTKYFVLKHDVETNVKRAYKMAEIEHKYGHQGTYYVQAYLLEDKENIALLQRMRGMGHEISYHYDVMDSCHGNIDAAIQEFEKNKALFEKNGFKIITVCQHGNPVVERVGYTSNRDFFRNSKVQKLYPNIADIMVDFKEKAHTEYLYFSDAGRKFNFIYDPINNDIVNSDDKNVSFETLQEMWAYIEKSGQSCIISTHPHRWTSSETLYVCKAGAFKCAKSLAKCCMKIPFLKKFMSKYYYLAKKI